MKKDIEEYLSYCQQNLSKKENTIDMNMAREYIRSLPTMYNSCIEFKLLFDWHFANATVRISENQAHPLFIFQQQLMYAFCKHYNLDYQFWQFFVFHALVDVKGKSLLEIGGSLPNEMIFDLFGVKKYINTESPDYIAAESGNPYTKKDDYHERRQTLFLNAEHIHKEVPGNTIDLVFSVACFEHIYDLDSALASCYEVQKDKGFLYSYFAPIYSYLIDGHHHVIPSHSDLNDGVQVGFHLLNHRDQRKQLEHAGISNPKDIQAFLGAVNFDRVPNRMYYEDYSRILTESNYRVVRMEDLPNYNISKQYPAEVARIRKSNPEIKNLHSMGFRVFLQK
jgi:SAM-dependent methyltransferase